MEDIKVTQRKTNYLYPRVFRVHLSKHGYISIEDGELSFTHFSLSPKTARKMAEAMIKMADHMEGKVDE